MSSRLLPLACSLLALGTLASFSLKSLLTLPPYFQLLLLANLGLWCFISNLAILHWYAVDTFLLFEPNNITRTVRSSQYSQSLYSLACVFSLLTLTSLWVYSYAVKLFKDDVAEYVPLYTYLLILTILCYPFDSFFRSGRLAFARSLIRSAFGSLNDPVLFSDVILSDILTSFAKVFGDAQLVFCDLMLSQSNRYHPNSDPIVTQFLQLIGSFLIALPFLFRFRQCVAEFNGSTSKDRTRHFQNAIKYVTSLPVIYSGYLLNYERTGFDPTLETASSKGQERRIIWAIQLWVLFSTISSIYSLYWDIIMDWRLCQSLAIQTSKDHDYKVVKSDVEKPHRRTSPIVKESLLLNPFSSHPSDPKFKHSYPFLRPILVFSPWVYYLGILINVLLRGIWISRISLLYSVLNSDDKTASSSLLILDVVLKILEIIRRWVWVFFRIEREWVDFQSFTKSIDS